MPSITDLLASEEGYSAKPYFCSEGYPTVGIGQKLGPRNAPLKNYTFTVPRAVADLWVRSNVDALANELDSNPGTQKAWRRLLAQATGAPYSDPRCCVYLSMAYQMGVDGLAKFVKANALAAVADWYNASVQMLDSVWAKQTPKRANRHAKQFETGVWAKEYK